MLYQPVANKSVMHQFVEASGGETFELKSPSNLDVVAEGRLLLQMLLLCVTNAL